ncbi:MAG: DNA mismatch repair endonuclease MutL [Patescibacteria group bacterium]
MPKIKQLSSQVVAKIAAGEVIQRPANIVKELVENSLDAGSTNIKIQLEDGGLRSLKIIDNGCGMEPDDLQLCYLPHTTSKITSEEHLLALNTFGFRGEALNSLTSVSNVQISSRTALQDVGTQINLEYGFDTGTSAYGMPIGTQIHVKELFHNLPARKKFLKHLRQNLDTFWPP